ncbi:hypothetical protein [Sphingomonas sp. GV3]|uniref:hypothetical protein n=1 Tax=Sphingomonas sp. GV3 TaxID=3040671 RepID=UPI00280B0043|nr:hypothetical protein [Sphingomonas sp. GV3]
MNRIVSIIPSILMAAYGGRLLLDTRGQLAEAQARHDRLLGDRLARGADAYADELRSLQAYRPIASIRQRRLLGALLFILSIASLSLLLFVPE